MVKNKIEDSRLYCTSRKHGKCTIRLGACGEALYVRKEIPRAEEFAFPVQSPSKPWNAYSSLNEVTKKDLALAETILTAIAAQEAAKGLQ